MKRTAIFLIAVTLIGAPVGPHGWHGVHAQEAKEQKPSKPKTRRSEALGKDSFRRIEKARSLTEEKKYDEAFALLQGISDNDRFKPYEKAIALQTVGYVHATKGDHQSAIDSFERAIASGHLPLRVVNALTYYLAQLNLAEDRPQKALMILNAWFAAIDGEARADAFGLKAQIHLTLDELPQAELAVREALSKADAPKQNWTRILLSVLLQQERYDEARPLLEDAVERWPGVRAFWQQLSNVYYQANEEKLAFVAQRAMHVQGMLTTSTELSRMAQLYLYHDVPIKAAQVLQRGMDRGTIEKTEKNYELLAQAYMHAREWSKSIEPLTKAAEASDKGRFYERLAQSYVQDEAWAEAEAAMQKALDKGGLDNEANSWLMLGIARARIEKYDAAIAAFRKAGDYDDVAKDAFRWIRSREQRLADRRRQAEPVDG